MDAKPFASLEACFGELPDARVQGRCDHKLIEIILIAICAVWCGAESWSEVEEFGQAKEAWLEQYLDLPAGIPSHDTFSRMFRLLDAAEFQRRFMIWVERHFGVPRGQVIAADGKLARGSRDSSRGQEVIRRLAFNWLKKHPATLSLKRKRFRAALDDAFLSELLTQVGCDSPGASLQQFDDYRLYAVRDLFSTSTNGY